MFARAKPEDQLREHLELVVLHGTVGSADGIEFSATSRRATVANGGGGGTCGKGFREKNATLMEEEMLVGDVVSQIADDPGFDGMGCRTPFVGGGGKNVKAAWMREVKFLFLDFPRSLVSGRSSVRVEQEERGASWEGIRRRKRSIRGSFVGHGVTC